MVETTGIILAEALQAIKSEASVVHDMTIINNAQTDLDTATEFIGLSRHCSTAPQLSVYRTMAATAATTIQKHGIRVSTTIQYWYHATTSRLKHQKLHQLI